MDEGVQELVLKY